MTDRHKKPYQWTLQRILAGVWFAGCAATMVALAYPVSIGIIRACIAAAIPGLWVLAIVLTRRGKWLPYAILAVGTLLGVFAALPGRPVDPDRLRTTYVTQLKQYQGTRYVWGGENGRGIDCSGLVRRALINAYLRIAVSTGNPLALRAGVGLWWHDCSALALLEQYRHFTIPVFIAPSINAIANPQLLPGDIAVTSNGIHVLAYIGDHRWVEADPGIKKVITLETPNGNSWFGVPVYIMRWSSMTGSANQASEAPE